jgi:hypothetical protein
MGAKVIKKSKKCKNLFGDLVGSLYLRFEELSQPTAIY